MTDFSNSVKEYKSINLKIKEVINITDDWRSWIGENILLGNDIYGIIKILVEAGISYEQAKKEIDSFNANPYLVGFRKMQNRLQKRDWILDVQSQLNNLRSIEIPKINKLSREDFLNNFYTTGRPVIITGMMDDWPALKKWNFEFFKENFGEKEVQVQFGRNSMVNFEINKQKLQKLMSFGEYTDLVRNAGKTNDFYMTANNTSINSVNLKELWNDVKVISEFLDINTKRAGYLWFGPKGTITPLHHDLTNNLFAQVIGRKRIIIIPSWEINKVYNKESFVSEVDILNIDYEKFPQMRDVRLQECILNPGEILFFPIGCWHFVESLDVSVSLTFTNFIWNNSLIDKYPKNTNF